MAGTQLGGGWVWAAGSVGGGRCEVKDGEVPLFGVSTIMARLWLPAQGGPSQHLPPRLWLPGREWAQRLRWRQEGLGAEGSRGVTWGDAPMRSRGRAEQSRTGGHAARGVTLAHPNQQGQLTQSRHHVPWPHGGGRPASTAPLGVCRGASGFIGCLHPHEHGVALLPTAVDHQCHQSSEQGHTHQHDDGHHHPALHACQPPLPPPLLLLLLLLFLRLGGDRQPHGGLRPGTIRRCLLGGASREWAAGMRGGSGGPGGEELVPQQPGNGGAPQGGGLGTERGCLAHLVGVVLQPAPQGQDALVAAPGVVVQLHLSQGGQRGEDAGGQVLQGVGVQLQVPQPRGGPEEAPRQRLQLVVVQGDVLQLGQPLQRLGIQATQGVGVQRQLQQLTQAPESPRRHGAQPVLAEDQELQLGKVAEDSFREGGKLVLVEPQLPQVGHGTEGTRGDVPEAVDVQCDLGEGMQGQEDAARQGGEEVVGQVELLQVPVVHKELWGQCL